MPQKHVMQFSKSRNTTRWIIIFASFLIISLILWNTYTFFQIFKNEERLKMEVLAESLKTINRANLETDDIELPRQIISNNKTIPVIVTTPNGTVINTANIDDDISKNPKKISALLSKLKTENIPIIIELSGEFQYLYYGNSTLLNKLKYYPIALLLIIVLFTALVEIVLPKEKQGISE